jgi:Putative citrate transport
LQNLVRDAIIIGIVVSLKLTPAEHRQANGFSWEPIREVLKLFAVCQVSETVNTGGVALTVFESMTGNIRRQRIQSEGGLECSGRTPDCPAARSARLLRLRSDLVKITSTIAPTMAPNIPLWIIISPMACPGRA